MTQNDVATGQQIDTQTTRACSGFDLEDRRRELIALRVKLGAKTPAGHRCSNLVEQLEHFRTAEGEQRAHLAKSIQKQLAELTALAPQSDQPQ